MGQDSLDLPEEMEELFSNLDEFTDSLTKILVNSEIIRTGNLRTELITSPQSQVEYAINAEKMQNLEGIEEVDVQSILDRTIQLNLMDQQYVKMREQMGEEESANSLSEPNEEENDGKNSKKSKDENNDFTPYI